MANAYERHDISDESWAKIELLLPGRKGTWGGKARDNRHIPDLFRTGYLSIPDSGNRNHHGCHSPSLVRRNHFRHFMGCPRNRHGTSLVLHPWKNTPEMQNYQSHSSGRHNLALSRIFTCTFRLRTAMHLSEKKPDPRHRVMAGGKCCASAL